MSGRGSAPASPILASSAALCAQATTIAPVMAAAIHRDTLPKDPMVVPPSQGPWRRRSRVGGRTDPKEFADGRGPLEGPFRATIPGAAHAEGAVRNGPH